MTTATRPSWHEEISRLDVAVYAAIAATATPRLDDAFRRLSRAADHSALWFGSAALLASTGRDRGRRAALNGLASLTLTSTTVNELIKPLSARRRPDRDTHNVPITRQVRMPSTTSFPSGHAASAFAFATGVATASPGAGIPLHAVVALVAYSRVHTGVHYPTDAIVGAVSRVALTPIALIALERWRRRRAPAPRTSTAHVR